MRLITTEEHVVQPEVARAGAAANRALSPHFAETYDPSHGLSASPTVEQLTDLGEGRIADMDTHGIDTQVVSVLGIQFLPGDVALELSRAANDRLGAAVREHPGRFAAFAAVPTTAGGAVAADELSRAVGELGAVGSMVFGRTGTDFLDAPALEPVLAASERLGVPVYLHPTPPPRGISDLAYAGLDPLVSARFETAGWGWHLETGVHFVHMVLSGVFDRHPDLQVVLGHWGETAPFFMERFDEMFPQELTRLERPVSEYFRSNLYITPSGMWSAAQLRFCRELVGVDRMIFSVDYPFIPHEGAREFLEAADLTPQDREKFAHGNAERLLGL
ncbi:amidohydrolase family protein [Kocuria sp.]|uniref:amidohydrolase family protein n=1 Tax=Kocuria sp. TaxID=1871328 RepID=UPI0026DDA2B5|nr:amidohydrolase family protein [Kocuria sp.]MDO4918801.1 amidohydrolase family protein [Kocuria sp.]